jgi:hypothetical protein
VFLKGRFDFSKKFDSYIECLFFCEIFVLPFNIPFLVRSSNHKLEINILITNFVQQELSLVAHHFKKNRKKILNTSQLQVISEVSRDTILLSISKLK